MDLRSVDTGVNNFIQHDPLHVGAPFLTGRSPLESPDQSPRYPQAIDYLAEWVKHIITVGSALMVLGAAFLKDLVRRLQASYSLAVATLLVLSYCAIIAAIWNCLAFTRRVANSFLATTGRPCGDDLQQLKNHLDRSQVAFLAALILFTLMALTAALAWAFGVTSSMPSRAAGEAPIP